MNIFKNLLFLHAYLIDPREADDPAGDGFASGYGNRIASGKAFAPLGHARTTASTAAGNASASDLCPTGACG